MMRDYGAVSPRFWTGTTGKKIRAMGLEAQVVAVYLLTCPLSNMIGFYYLPLPVLAHETGIPLEGASKALRSLSEALFCHYDEAEEVVWVVEMAKHQIADRLDAKDNRCKGISRELDQYRKSIFFNEFHRKYRDAFHLPDISPSEAPYEPLRSQDRDSTETRQSTTSTTPTNEPSPPLASPPSASGAEAAEGKPRRKAKPRGRDFGVAALEMSSTAEAALKRVWNGYPRQGWNFTTKRPAPRRIDYAETAKRFSEILQFCPIRTSEGAHITPDDLADATLAWIQERIKEARRDNSEIPNVPCIANFFSSVEGSKHHWKEALLEYFEAIPEAACH